MRGGLSLLALWPQRGGGVPLLKKKDPPWYAVVTGSAAGTVRGEGRDYPVSVTTLSCLHRALVGGIRVSLHSGDGQF